jgi:hypothetical protein
MLGQIKRQRRFTACSRPGNNDGSALAQLRAPFETAASRLPQDEVFLYAIKLALHGEEPPRAASRTTL